MPSNLIVLNPQRGDSIALTAVTSAYRQPSAFQPIGQTVYSTASIPANAANALYGKGITISGFANPLNNGTFVVLASTATSITVNNAFGVVVAAAGSASFQTTGTPAQYASKVENMWSNQNGDNVTVNANTGDTLIGVVIGLKQIVGFDQLHGTAPYYPQFGNNAGNSGDYPNGGFNFGQLQGLNDFNANPSISDLGNGAGVDILSSSLAAGTLTVQYVNPNTAIPPAALPLAYFAPAELVSLAGMKEAWLNGTTQTIVTSTVTGTAPNFISKFTATVTPPTLVLTQSEGSFALPGGQLVNNYVGVITNGANDAYAGTTFLIAGFTHAANNGSFLCVSSTSTILTLVNTAGVEELHAGTAAVTAYSQANDEGDATPAGNTWTIEAMSSIIDSDYTVTYPFSGPTYTPGAQSPQILKFTRNGVTYTINYVPQPTTATTVPYQSSKWNIDGYYPSIYIFVATGVKAGSYKVNLNSMYQPGDANNNIDWSQGSVPIFDGGVNFQVFNFSGAAATIDGTSISATETILNPATAPAPLVTAGTDGDLLFSVGLLKNGNTFQAGTTGATPTSLALTAVKPLNYGPYSQTATTNFGGAVYTGTITGGANNFFVGYQFTVTGFTNALNNGTFTCTASTATTLTLTNGVAVTQTGATGHAAYVPPMTQIGNGKLVNSEAHYIVEYALTAAGSAGTFNPGFNNPLGYPMLVASIAIQSS